MKIQDFHPAVVAIVAVLLTINSVVWFIASLSDVFRWGYSILVISMFVVVLSFEIWRIELNEPSSHHISEEEKWA